MLLVPVVECGGDGFVLQREGQGGWWTRALVQGSTAYLLQHLGARVSDVAQQLTGYYYYYCVS